MANGLRRYGHPGKFEGELAIAEYVYKLVGESWQDDEIGSVDEMGWYGLFRFKDTENKARFLKGLEEAAAEEGESLTPEERKFVMRLAGLIVSESESGGFGVNWFTNKRELDAAWSEIQDDYEKFYEEEGMD